MVVEMSTFNFLTCNSIFHFSEHDKFEYFSQTWWDIHVCEKIYNLWRDKSPMRSVEILEDVSFRVILKDRGSK